MLPEDAFVFCCFNNSYKIAPALFDIWSRLLKRVPGSVLWLLESNELARRNLRREAEQRGVDPERLVFAPIQPIAVHLARHRHADLPDQQLIDVEQVGAELPRHQAADGALAASRQAHQQDVAGHQPSSSTGPPASPASRGRPAVQRPPRPARYPS